MPGIHIPDSVIARLEGAQDQKKEGKQLCIDIINEVKEIEGVSGVHVMAYRQEEYVAEIVHESGVLKGRTPWKRESNLAPTSLLPNAWNPCATARPKTSRKWPTSPRIARTDGLKTNNRDAAIRRTFLKTRQLS